MTRGRLIKAMGWVALMIAAVLVGLTATPSAGFATSGCGTRCENKDPFTYVYGYNTTNDTPIYCKDDARSVGNPSWVYAGDRSKATLMFSPRCRTAWARIDGENAYGKIQAFNSNGSSHNTHFVSVWDPAGNSITGYTTMVNDAGYEAYACSQDWQVDGGAWACTGKW